MPVKPRRWGLRWSKHSGPENLAMNVFRAVLMFAVGVFAIYRGWTMHSSERAWLAYGLGLVAIALGVWRLMRNPNKPLA
jgi:uncharacterized membrane protein HdeD (DUF308 family)